MHTKLMQEMATPCGGMHSRRRCTMLEWLLRYWMRGHMRHMDETSNRTPSVGCEDGFTRKARWVLDGHKKLDPIGSTYAGVVSRESVRRALT